VNGLFRETSRNVEKSGTPDSTCTHEYDAYRIAQTRRAGDDAT